MVRPRKVRRIGYRPEFDEYTPSKDRCIELTFEELESIRLIDYEKLNQQESKTWSWQRNWYGKNARARTRKK